MIKVKNISVDQFKEKFKLKELNPFSNNIFSAEDIKKIRQDYGIIDVSTKLKTIPDLISLFIKEPLRIIKSLPKIIKVHFSGIKQFYYSKSHQLKDTYPFSDYVLKASILGISKPKKILEIGTARGWGSTAFQLALPDCICYTMSPKNTRGANNELPQAEIGKAFRKKKLPVKQIWSDSYTFDFNSIAKVDASFIDGNHKYKWVYSDLVNCNRITKKLIIVDDYIPSANSPRGNVLDWGWWNQETVKAVYDFLKSNPKGIKEAYWIKNTCICVLIKNDL